MEDYYCNVLADNVSDFFREKMIYEQRKTDMLIYTTEDGLTKVETTFMVISRNYCLEICQLSRWIH